MKHSLAFGVLADPLPSWNDGTLWLEQPLYTQFIFAIDQFKQLTKNKPTLEQALILKKLAHLYK